MENFTITTDLSQFKGFALETNFEAVKAQVLAATETDRTLIVSEDSISVAKKRMAELRKAKSAVDDYRKTMVKVWDEPIQNAIAQAKELTGIIDDAITNYDSQVKKFEREIKDAKIESLRKFFSANSAQVIDYLTFERIFNPKWENSGYKLETAQNDILEAINQTVKDVELIRSFNSEFEVALLDEYAESGDLHTVAAKKNALESRQKAAEAQRAQESVIIPHTAEKPAESVSEPSETIPVSTFAIPFDSGITPSVPFDEPAYTLTLRFTVTKKEAVWLKRTLDDNGIEYKKVKEN